MRIGDNMKEEKMLIEIKEKNIFKKAINFIKRIFFKGKKQDLSYVGFYNKDNSFIKQFDENKKILNMQKRFESGELKETDLTKTEKSNLIKLYNEQIMDLKRDIENYKRALNSYKDKILVVRSKLNS